MIGILLLSDLVSALAPISTQSHLWPVLNHLPWLFSPHSAHSKHSLCVVSYTLWVLNPANSQICESQPSAEVCVWLNSVSIYPIAKLTFCSVIPWACKIQQNWIYCLLPCMYPHSPTKKTPTLLMLAKGATINWCYIIFGSQPPCLALHFMGFMTLFVTCQSSSSVRFMFYPYILLLDTSHLLTELYFSASKDHFKLHISVILFLVWG